MHDENILLDVRADVRAEKSFKKLLDAIESESNELESIDSGLTEEFLIILLNAMSWAFILSKNFRKNIKNFDARYLFLGDGEKICVSVIFKNGKMRVHHKKIDEKNLTIKFKDSKALRHYLFSPNDLLTPILHQDIMTEGNINYLTKFGYMSNHLMLLAKKLWPSH
ncbi:MAG: hypothetical protein KAX49_16135 [Halanaerobiales bacterium]|nr:hypothetical protein [Halanaerobiales bacterium]